MTSSTDEHESSSSTTVLKAGKLPGALLARLIDTYRTRADPDVVITPGYGRDAAAIDTGAVGPVVVKSDPITFATDAAARYLVAVNANDIACLGGIPRWFSVVLLLPTDTTTIGEVETLFADLQSACNDAGVSIIGGHTEVTDAVNRPVFVGTMIGVAGSAGLLTPGAAKPGDDLLLTKWIGIEGTALLARERANDLIPAIGEQVVHRAAKLLRLPGISIVRDAATVLAVDGVTALHDPTEGGIATAIHEIASASQCGADVLADSLPVLPETTAICAHFGIDPLGLLSSGALLIAAAPQHRRSIELASSDAGIPITRIGRLTEMSEGVTMISGAGRVDLPRFDSDEITRAL
jgi:hydrogenase maturation factor